MIDYLGYEWILLDDDTATFGVSEEGLDRFGEILSVNLPDVGDDVFADKICVELITEEGTMNLYSPIKGEIIEVNEAVAEEPTLIAQDCYGDGWIFKVQASDTIDEDEVIQLIRELDA